MIAQVSIAPLRVANEGFMVAATIERCPRQMMLRELVMNALEAAAQATGTPKQVFIDAVTIGEVPKLRIWNTGRGLSQTELLQISDLSSSLFKTVALDGNFGMGAKAASLASNKHGLRYRSCRLGKVSQILLGARDGVYGRVLQKDPSGAGRREAIDVTASAAAAGDDLSHDWTEVTLFGNSPEQDTASDPYAGDPALPRDWVAQTLGRRFMRLPEGVELAIDPSASGAAAREIFTPTLSQSSFDRIEAVEVGNGVVIHYGYRAKDSARPLPRVNIVGVGAIVYDGEIYALTDERRWALEAPTYGFTFAARQCTVAVELPHAFPARPEQYRQFLRFNDGDQHQVQFADFGDLVRHNLPAWLKRIIASLLPTESDYLAEIRDEMRQLLAALGIEDLLGAPQKPAPKALPDQKTPAEAYDSSSDLPKPPKRPEAPSPPEIITLEEEADIVEKALGGRAARYYPAARQVFINARYATFARMRAQLAEEFAPFADEETIQRLAKLTSEWAIIQRIARTLLHSIGKPKSGWSADEVKTVQSPETMSLMVDDIEPLLVPARRRIAAQLGLEADKDGVGGFGVDPSAQRAAGELAEAEAQLQRAMANNAQSVGRFYRQIASIHSRRRNFAAARACLETGMAADPADAWCRFDYAGLMLAGNDFDGAAKYAEEALSLSSDNSIWFHLRRADVELRRGNLRQAEAKLIEAAAHNPEIPWAHHDLAGLYLQEERLDAAEAAILTALERSPDVAKLVQRRADIALLRGDREAAKTLYEQAMALGPDDPWIRLPFAKLHATEGQFEKAQGEIDVALALRPDAEAPFLRARSEIAMQQGDRGMALASALQAVRSDPADMWSHLHLAGVFLNIGDLDRAVEALVEAERVAPGVSPAIYRRRAEVESRRNNLAGALEFLDQAAQASPKDPWIWLEIAAHRTTLNDLDAAEDAAARAEALMKRTDRSHVLRRRAQIAIRRKDSETARALLREATQVAPGDCWAWLDAANYAFNEGDFDAAVEAAQKATAVSPRPNVHIFSRAAAFEERRENWDAARDYLRQAIAADADDPQPWYHLANILAASGDLDGAQAAAEKAVHLASRGRESVGEEVEEVA